MKKLFLIILLIFIPLFSFADSLEINNKSDFDLGNYINSYFDDNEQVVKIKNGFKQGVYESKIFDFNREANINRISWVPNFPIKKELPNNGIIESVYSQGNINMSDNVLLMHLNTTAYSDTSLNSNNGSCESPNCPVIEDGVLDKAIKINGLNLSRVSIADNNTIDPGADEFSICHWFKIDDASGTDEILYNKENLYEARVNNGYYHYAWRPHWAWDGGSSFQVNSNEWYHACLVYDKTKQILYKNGEEVYRRNQTGDMGVNSNNLCLGARGTNNCNNSRYTGLIDEFSIWKRALTAEEVKNIYLRGATNLKIQVRSCDNSQCSGESYSNNIFDIVEGNNILPTKDLVLDNNNYFQFKILLDSLNPNFSPELKSVKINYELINHPPIDIQISSLSINENSPINTDIGDISVNDIDASDIHLISLSCSTSGSDDGDFNINNNKLRNSNIFDYETKNSYNICLKVDDQNGGIFEKNFVVFVNDINNPPTDINLSNTNINENIPANSIIASITNTDDGEDGNYTYSLEIFGDSQKFTINGNNLLINESPDYESQNSYSIRIKVNDGANEFFKDFVINVNDSLENTPPVITNDENIYIDENENFIMKINVVDNDIPAQNFIYFISGGEDANKFSINSVNGNLYFINKKDFEKPDDTDEDNIYKVEVSVIDNGQPRMISSKNFNIKINDIKEVFGKSRKINRKTKIVYRDRIVYKEKACSIIGTEVDKKLIKIGKKCSQDKILTQNLRSGAKDGSYHWYTKSIVKEVKILQAHMNRLGFNAGPVDGILGPLTDAAIKRMQKYLGTEPDGYVGPKTRALINNSCK